MTEERIKRAQELLSTVNHAAMATVNEDGSPHNTPYFFMISSDLKLLYWGSHPDSQHSKNISRTGELFVVLYDAIESGGLYIKAEQGRVCDENELEAALEVHNARRTIRGKTPLSRSYYQDGPQQMWQAVAKNFYVNYSTKDQEGRVEQDLRKEVARELLVKD